MTNNSAQQPNQARNSTSPTSPRLLDSTILPPPSSPQRVDFALGSPALSFGRPGSSTAGSSSFRRVSTNGDFTPSPATALTWTTTGSLDPLQLPPSSYVDGESVQGLAGYSPGLHLNAVPLVPPALVQFYKGNQSFKLSYERMHVCQAATGELKHIEMSGSDPDGFVNSAFTHTFAHTTFPVPHLETPMTPETKPPYAISFLDKQAVNASSVTFEGQPHYYFYNWQDCVNFQETLLGKRVVFIAGMNKARSKGRGEESISQNIRLLESRSGGGLTILFFANSQSKANKSYIWLSGDGIDSVERKKDTVTLKLNPEALDVLSTLKTLYIEFLNQGDAETFCSFIDPEHGSKDKHKGKEKRKSQSKS